jgi:hypothetical protein
MKDSIFALALLIGVWCVAIVGLVLKLVLPGRFDRLSVGLFLAMGWSGVMLYDAVVAVLPAMALWFVIAGGALYSLGVIFHAWQRLRFPERDLALLRAAGRGLPLHGGARSGPDLEILSKAEVAMQVTGKIVVVTGGANGIGRALCEAFHRAGAGQGCSSPISIRQGARATAAKVDGAAFKCDVGKETDIRPRHRGDRAAVRPDCAVLLQCRHRRWGSIRLSG